MAKLFKNTLLLLIVYGFITGLFWTLTKTHNLFDIIILLAGLFFGSNFLNIDHILNWHFSNFSPGIQALRKGDYKQVLDLIKKSQDTQTNLIFHQFYVHLVIIAVSIFLFSSNATIFGRSFLLAINVHLLFFLNTELKQRPEHLQAIYFARMQRQLPIKFLHTYTKINAIITLAFALLLFIK